MSCRPFPDRDRALRQVQRTRVAYRYGRAPRRVVIGIEQADVALQFLINRLPGMLRKACDRDQYKAIS